MIQLSVAPKSDDQDKMKFQTHRDKYKNVLVKDSKAKGV